MQGDGGRRCLWLLAAALAMPAAAPPPAAAQDLGSWTPAAPLPTPRRLLAAAAEGGRLYTFGGCGSPCFSPPQHVSTDEETRVEVFDPTTNLWSVRQPMPYVFFGGAAAAPGDGFVYTLGGVVSGATVMRYDPDPEADAWSPRAPLPTPRHGLAAAALGGEVYAVGGSDGRAATGALEIYDPDLDRWRPAAPMPTPRAQLAAAALGGRLYVFGGFVPGAGVLAETLEYDPETDGWRRLADLPALPGEETGGRDQAAVAVLGELAHLVGGSVDCHCRALDGHGVFDPPDDPPDDGSPIADLACALAAPPAVARAGGALAFTLTVANHGPDAAPGARVALLLPPRLSALAWSCTPSPGAACPAAGAGALEAPVDLPAGGSLRFDLVATAVAAASCPLPAGPLAVEARATAPAGVSDPRRGNDRCAAVVAAVYEPVADLRLAQVPAPGTPLAGRPAGFLLTAHNTGPDAACGATLTSTPPCGLEGPAWTCAAPGPCAPPAGGAPGALDLLPGESAALALTGTIAADAPCCEVAHEAAIAPPPGVVDPVPENDEATAVLALALCPSPTATKTATPAVVDTGEPVEFVVTLVNPSAFPLLDGDGDEWVDPLPPEIAPVEVSADDGLAVLDGETVRWNGELPAGGRVEIRVSALVEPGHEGAVVCNQGTLRADGDGDGVVDLEVPTDDPGLPGTEDPTCFEIAEGPNGGDPNGEIAIPALGGVGRAFLAALLAAAGALALRRRGGRRQIHKL